MVRMSVTALLLLSAAIGGCSALSPGLAASKQDWKHVGRVESVTFLVTVNDTWWPEEEGGTCLKTVKTPPILPNRTKSESQSFSVGKCDHGPLIFTLTNIDPVGRTTNHTYIAVTFFSSVIEDASPPTCKMLWDYSYLEPTSPTPKESLLPGCFVMDSREGYHMTYYWFHALDWSLQ